MRRQLLIAGYLVFGAFAGLAQAQSAGQDSFEAGMRYHVGDGVLQDYAQAVEYMQSAAEAGYAPAQNMLGRYYFEGLGVTQDRALAVEWLEAAAQSGIAEYVLDLAKVLETDPATLPRAASLYERAAEAGLAEAYVYLGLLYQEGRGVAQDFEKARALYEGPAAAGHPRALNNLGLLYVRAQSVAQDYERAATLFAAAAEQGLKQAMTNLAVLYENGFGVPLDEARAAELYRAAGQGKGPEKPVTYVYDTRLNPPDSDLQALVQVVNSGDPVARFQWAWLVLSNDESAFSDRQLAALFTRRMAEQGHAPSMMNLGLLYTRGIGVPQDFVLGHKWLLLAKARGVTEAESALRNTTPLLTSEQINEAQRRAQDHE